MAGLFSTPEQVRQAQLLASTPGMSALNRAAFEFGSRGAGALGQKFFDIDPRSREEIRAQSIQEQLQGLDPASRESVFAKAKGLFDTGNFQEGATVLQLLPAVGEVPDQFGELKFHDIDVTDPTTGKITRRRVMGQRNLVTNELVTKGGVTVQEAPAGAGGRVQKFPRLPTITTSEPMTDLIEESIVSVAQDVWGLDENDVKLKGISGKILTVADGARNAEYIKRIEDGTINTRPLEGDSFFIQQTVNDILSSGALTDFVTFNEWQNNQVALNPTKQRTATELKRLRKQEEVNAALREKNLAAVRALTRGDVTAGEINLRNIPSTIGEVAFANFETDNFSTILEKFRNQGVDVQRDGPALQSFVQNLTWMKQVPEYTRAWLNARGGDTGVLSTSTITNRKNLFTSTTEQLLEENRMQEFWVTTNVNNFLNRMKKGGRVADPRQRRNF